MKLNIRIRLKTITLMMFLLAFNVYADSVDYEFIVSSRSIMRTGPDQTLEKLVQELYPNKQALWPRLVKEIRRINPHGFNRYTGKIIPGQRIQLVTIKTLRKSHILNQYVVGSVESVKGYAIATDTNGHERALLDKADLYEGDRLTTEKNATVVVKMVDDAKIFLKPDSSVRITEYKMKSGFEKGSKSILDLIKGGLRTITGAIGANPLSTYRFHTGVVTIGVRGTDYIIMLCDENDCKNTSSRNDPGARLHVLVLDGLISLQDEEGSVGELIMGQYAVATQQTKVIVNDTLPVGGLLNPEELEIYNELTPKLKEKKEGESSPIWPWILGGALFGL